MSSVRILIDKRESALTSFFHSDPAYTLEPTVLDVGDIHIVQENPPFVLVFERKTLSDLAASIKDGRYKEQKLRMNAYTPAHRITYMVEGGDCFSLGDHAGLQTSVFAGMYVHTMYRDGMHVMYPRNMQETANWIMLVAKKCAANPTKFVTDTTTDYVATCKVKTKKISNITPHTCYIMQLCQIPGISHRIAQEIASVYPNLRTLLNVVDDDQANKKLHAIPLLGKKKIEVLVEYLRNI